MTKVRQVIQRDIGTKVEGVVKVFDREALATEIREYVLTDKIEDELKRILDTFTHVSETLKHGAKGRDVMGIWVSGFFGSGKSHFAKVLGYLLANPELDPGSGETCIDAFEKHLPATPRGQDIRLRLGEVKLGTQVFTVPFEIKSRQSLNNPNSVGEILLSEFYRRIGLAEHFVVARIERQLQKKGQLEELEKLYLAQFDELWAEGRDNLLTVRRRLAKLLPQLDPGEFKSEQDAKESLADMFSHATINPETIAGELVQWVDQQETASGKVQHLVFVIDEMGTFIGDSSDRISELNALAEMIGNKGKGKVWLIVTSQLDLEAVVNRTNFDPVLIGRLNARFELKPHLISDEINKVVSERILKKKPAEEGPLKELYQQHEGHLASLVDLKASRDLGALSDRRFIDAYPFLPEHVRLAQEIFEALSGFRLSGGVRSMISVTMDALQEVADEDIGVLVSFDQVFDAVQNDLLSQEYLGASGVKAIYDADEFVHGTPIKPTRVLKTLWLLQQIQWVPRVPETIAKLLVRDVTDDVPALRAQVDTTLAALQEAGYVARDEATGEWKFLNEKERTIEQFIQELIRPGGPRSISTAAIRRTSVQLCKTDVLTKRQLANYAVAHGRAGVPFGYALSLDGESIESGPDIEIRFVSPLAASRTTQLETAQAENQAQGARGRVAWWFAEASADLEARLKRYEALVKVTEDKRFTEDAAASTQDALSEKRKERDELRRALVRELEAAYLRGRALYGGQQFELEAEDSLNEVAERIVEATIPHVYPQFSKADRPYDFAKQLKELLNPSTKSLGKVAPELDLFDSQGNLQRESALVSQVLEVLNDLEQEGDDITGGVLLDARDRTGFRGFSRPPFHWPDELVRLVLAACFRAGVIYLEKQTPVGPSPVYDYRESNDFFAKITQFKKTQFRVAETSLTVDQLKQANRALIAMGRSSVPESGNAIASAVRELGSWLQTQVVDAKTRREQGLPIAEVFDTAEEFLKEPITLKDPTAAVTAFLGEEARWAELVAAVESLRQFLDANRHQEFAQATRLFEALQMHPVAESHAAAAPIAAAMADANALIEGTEVIDRWQDFRGAVDTAFQEYRAAYLEAYDQARGSMAALEQHLIASDAYTAAPEGKRDEVLQRYFGSGGACHFPALALASTTDLLAAVHRHGLTALQQTVVARDGYRLQILGELKALGAEPPPKTTEAEAWDVSVLLGRSVKNEAELDELLKDIDRALRPLVKKKTVVIK